VVRKLISPSLSTLEQQNRNLAKVKVDKVLCFMCHVASKVSSDNDVPFTESKEIRSSDQTSALGGSVQVVDLTDLP
jgi:hypothetical protein